MIDKFTLPVARVLNELAKRRVQESAGQRQTGDRDWWKPLESILGLLGGVADDLNNLLEEDKAAGRAPTLDLPFFFDQVIPGLLTQTDTPPFLQGRAFVFASQFAGSLSKNVAEQYLNATVQALGSDAGVTVKICAVKTVRK